MPILAYPISPTPAPYKIPKAGSDGKIAAGWLPDLSGTYVTLVYGDANYQGKDATLTALAAFNTNGLMTQTAPDTFAGRSLAAGTGINVSNGDGVSGNPTVAIDSTVVTLAGAQTLTDKTLASPTIAKIGNLTGNGFVKTSGGDGTLGIDTSTYLTGNQTITLSSDLSGSGATAIAATVLSVGGSLASNIHSAELLANAATALNTASAIVKRDANGNVSINGVASGVVSVTPTGGTTNLAVSDPTYIHVVGGTGTNHTFVLPDARLLPVGIRYVFSMIALPTSTISISDNAGSTIASFGSGNTIIITLYDNSTQAGGWDAPQQTGAGATVHSNNAVMSNTTLNTATSFNGNLNIGNGVNLAFSSSTGSKIGTAANQKLAFYNATPIVQPSGTGETAGFSAGGGTNVTDASTFTGNVGSTAYRISDVVKALKNLGLLAA